jgi:biotin carboxyl carrier protein
MKYNVKVGNETFEVEIEDINARPVIARVDGETFEVVPGNDTVTQNVSVPAPSVPAVPAALPRGGTIQGMSGTDMLAPLPGTVTEVFVKPGEKIESGQIVLIIDAMKMKNSIRAVRSGTVGQVLVSPGQSVGHKQALIRFADSGEAAWI